MPNLSNLKNTVVGMGKAIFVDAKSNEKISSGSLTMCSFAAIRAVSNKKTLGFIFLHHGTNDKNDLIEQVKKMNFPKGTKLNVEAIRTAGSTEIANTSTQDTQYDKTDDQLYSILEEITGQPRNDLMKVTKYGKKVRFMEREAIFDVENEKFEEEDKDSWCNIF